MKSYEEYLRDININSGKKYPPDMKGVMEFYLTTVLKLGLEKL